RPIHQWSFVSAFDVAAKCDEKRAARLANAAGDLGVDAESDQPGTKLGAIFDARRQSRCVPDTQYFPEGPPAKKPAGGGRPGSGSACAGEHRDRFPDPSRRVISAPWVAPSGARGW